MESVDVGGSIHDASNHQEDASRVYQRFAITDASDTAPPCSSSSSNGNNNEQQWNGRGGFFTSPPPPGDPFPEANQVRAAYHQLGAILDAANGKCATELWNMKQAYGDLFRHNQFLQETVTDQEGKFRDLERQLQYNQQEYERESGIWLQRNAEQEDNLASLWKEFETEVRTAKDLKQEVAKLKESEKQHLERIQQLEVSEKGLMVDCQNLIKDVSAGQREKESLAKVNAQLEDTQTVLANTVDQMESEICGLRKERDLLTGENEDLQEDLKDEQDKVGYLEVEREMLQLKVDQLTEELREEMEGRDQSVAEFNQLQMSLVKLVVPRGKVESVAAALKAPKGTGLSRSCSVGRLRLDTSADPVSLEAPRKRKRKSVGEEESRRSSKAKISRDVEEDLVAKQEAMVEIVGGGGHSEEATDSAAPEELRMTPSKSTPPPKLSPHLLSCSGDNNTGITARARGRSRKSGGGGGRSKAEAAADPTAKSPVLKKCISVKLTRVERGFGGNH